MNTKVISIHLKGLKLMNIYNENQQLIAAMPTVAAYSFTNEEMALFRSATLNGPLIMDINISAGCKLQCRYCFTHGQTRNGKVVSMDRFGLNNGKSLVLRDDEILDIVKQYSKTGGKTLFVCSNGEPLMNRRVIERIISQAHDYGIKVFILTNMHEIQNNLKYIKTLRDHNVSLGLKFEHVIPMLNNYILRPTIKPFKYGLWNGLTVPNVLRQVYETYAEDGKTGFLAISTMALALNKDVVLDIRQWAYDSLEIAHFLKHVYAFGNAISNSGDILMDMNTQSELDVSIVSYDRRKGILYPSSSETVDKFSYDIRRLFNNLLNINGFPARIAIHMQGMYLSNISVKPSFGVKPDEILMSVRKHPLDPNSKISLAEMFRNIQKHITSNRLDAGGISTQL